MVLAPLLITLWAHLAMPEMGTPPPQRLLHRWYSPTQGRFLSRDPIGFDGGQINLYQYVGNNPVLRRDPSGLGPMVDLYRGLAAGFAEVAAMMTISIAQAERLICEREAMIARIYATRKIVSWYFGSDDSVDGPFPVYSMLTEEQARIVHYLTDLNKTLERTVKPMKDSLELMKDAERSMLAAAEKQKAR